ncbi:MAG TPA: hypothetical protein VOB72_15290 [Candidatus Dormibacteraeota bacterium]|nr:hypothetical protein [Candidatus Dormibacteraeota bacterium]
MPSVHRLSVQWLRRRTATTPGRLRLLRALVAAATLALLGTGCGALAAALVTETNVHQRTVTAIVGVQRLHAWLAAADRSAANSYLSGGAELTLPQQQYEADVAAASRELEQAAERRPADVASDRLQAISQSLGEYTRMVDTAMVQHRLGNPDGMVALRGASDLMHRPGDGILAQVDAVEAIYTSVLRRTGLTLAAATVALAVFVGVAVVVLGLLVWTQRFVRRRFRRRRNKRLLAATLAALVVVAGTVTGAAAARQSIARSQGQYARLLNLWHARSLAYDANGATSLFLIAGGPAPPPASQLVDQPLSDELLRDAGGGHVRFGGLLADELRAAGSRAERDAALRVLTAYRQFVDIDVAVHAQATAGHQAAAVTLTLGTYGGPLGLAFKSMDWGPRLGAQRDWSEGELGFAFEEFDWDLAQLTQLVQVQFDATMTGVERALAETIGLQALSVAVAALTFAGLRPRIAEYAA